MQYNYPQNWPNAWDQVKEFIEGNQTHYSKLNEYDQRRLINKLIVDEQDQADFLTSSLADTIAFFVLKPTKALTETLRDEIQKSIEEGYSKLINAMFEDAAEQLARELKRPCEMRAFKDKRDFQMMFAGAR